MKLFLLSLFALAVGAQSLPDYLIGTGPSWVRGAAYPLNDDTVFALRLGTSNWFSQTDITTPLARNPGSTAPLPSTITTGATYVMACSASKKACLLFTILGGVSAASGGAAAAPSFAGNLAASFRLGTSVYLIPYVRASNASYSPTSGALATAIISPGVIFALGLNKTAAPASPTVKQMRAVMRRLGLLYPSK